MKKIVLLFPLIIIGAGGYAYFAHASAPAVETSIPSVQNVESDTQEVVHVFSPDHLVIPKLKVDSEIEFVGLAKDGRMDIPKDDMNTAWYKDGTLPGEIGSAVIAGHFDTKTGGPAVFNTLSELSSGDTIIVTGGGEKRTFVVTEVKVFKDETFPVDTVFYKKDGRYLNLITCDGVFDEVAKNYSDRLVVFSVLKDTV